MKKLYTKEQIYELIPQRPPIVMVDTIFEDKDGIGAALTICEDNIFVDKAHLQEVGIIEHIAQTAAALAGYAAKSEDREPSLGYIGEIKNFECVQLPKVGQTLTTNLDIIAEMNGVKLALAHTFIEDTQVAECQMKIFIPDNEF